MLKPLFATVVLTVTAVVFAAQPGEGVWPFMTIRQTGWPARVPEQMEEVIAINARHPGSCDEYWFAHGAGPRMELCEKEFLAVNRFRSLCERAGIAVGFQQGVTLGHGSIYSPAGGGQEKEQLHPFTDEAWQVGRDGQRVLMFCPRSPEVLEYEERYVELLCRTMNPVSLWLDDDLRMGMSKPDGCFCERCLAAFNAKNGLKLTREELVARLYGGEAKDDVRRAWRAFCAESLAIYGAAARRGADRVNPKLRIAYQSVRPYDTHSGVDNFPLLDALAGHGRTETAIRVGDGCYFESADEMVRKAMFVAYEAERCRASGVRVASISYEQECYTREVLHKSPEAIMIESAISIAAGCDALTEYWWDAGRNEPLSYYDEFAQTVSEWRPYLERLAKTVKTTTLGGTARFVGSDCDRILRWNLEDELDVELARIGVPVTVQPARNNHTFYFTNQSLEELGAGDLERLLSAKVVVQAEAADQLKAAGGERAAKAFDEGRWIVFDFKKVMRRGVTMPTTSERNAMLDVFDRAGPLPVRMERTHRFRVFPRLDSENRVAAVTVFNLSIGRSFPARLIVRQPAGTVAVWARPGEPDRTLELKDGAVEIPSLPGSQIGTVFFISR